MKMTKKDMIKKMVEAGDSEFVLTLDQIAERMLEACIDAGMYPPSLWTFGMGTGVWEDEDEA